MHNVGIKPESHSIAEPQSITLKEFLEDVHPSVSRLVRDVWEDHPSGSKVHGTIVWPDVRLHCKKCSGFRTYRSKLSDSTCKIGAILTPHPIYLCGDCQDDTKQYSLKIVASEGGKAEIYKFGEVPPFGIPTPNKLLKLFGSDDAKIFIKGRQCENLGYGIGAFAYYRRVVENHKNDLLNEIIKVCNVLGIAGGIVDELESAKLETSFSASIERIKSGLPQGLLIRGHNPLTALHGALSGGIHNDSDEECLAAAHAVRIVLSELVEKIATLKQDDRQLNEAVQFLLSKRSKAT